MAKSDPPVLVISGACSAPRERFLSKFVSTMQASGWRPLWISGNDIAGYGSAFVGSMFVTEKILLIVEEPGDKLAPLIKEHHEAGDGSEVVIVMLFRGSAKTSATVDKLVASLKAQRKDFPEAPPWEQPKIAAAFALEEARFQGKVLSPGLADVLVQRVGSDQGVLSFEILKARMLADSLGKAEIDGAVLKQSMAVLAEANVMSLLDVLMGRQQQRIAAALKVIKSTTKGDPTMKVCRMLGSQVVRVAAVAVMSAKGLGKADMATALGVKEGSIYAAQQHASRMPEESARRLVQILAESERAVLNGGQAPWIGLCARLLAWSAA